MKPLNLIKLAVGVEDVDHLARLQKARLEKARAAGLGPALHHVTRMWPTRRAEILDGGGSIYWVIRGAIRARQRIVAFEEAPNPNLDSGADPDGEPGTRRSTKPYCAITLAPDLVATRPSPHRAFQGWRYFDPAKAPPDAKTPTADDLPADLARELDELGLL